MGEPKTRFDIQAALGAKPALSQEVAVYLPDKDKDGNPVARHDDWVQETKELLTEMNGGATVMPPAAGAWHNTATGSTIHENTVIVYSFIRGRSFVDKISLLRELLHRFGRETSQGVVVFEFARQFYEIEDFDEPKT